MDARRGATNDVVTFNRLCEKWRSHDEAISISTVTASDDVTLNCLCEKWRSQDEAISGRVAWLVTSGDRHVAFQLRCTAPRDDGGLFCCAVRLLAMTGGCSAARIGFARVFGAVDARRGSPGDDVTLNRLCEKWRSHDEAISSAIVTASDDVTLNCLCEKWRSHDEAISGRLAWLLTSGDRHVAFQLRCTAPRDDGGLFCCAVGLLAMTGVVLLRCTAPRDDGGLFCCPVGLIATTGGCSAAL